MARTTLATNAQVLQTASFNSDDEVGGEDVVDEAISEAEAEVSGNYSEPIKRATFTLVSLQTKYEYRNDNEQIYRIDQVFVIDSNNNRIEYTNGTASEVNHQFTLDTEFNTVTFHSDTISTYDGMRVLVNYVMLAHHQLVKLKAALSLIDTSNLVNGEENMPAIAIRLMGRIKRIENSLTPFSEGSTNNSFYDGTRGEVIPQRRFHTF